MLNLFHNYYVYIVECSNGSYYTGITNELERRIEVHNVGLNADCYTYKRRPVTLKYYAHHSDVRQAIAWEKQIKGLSRKKKEASIEQNWEWLQLLAQRYS